MFDMNEAENSLLTLVQVEKKIRSWSKTVQKARKTFVGQQLQQINGSLNG